MIKIGLIGCGAWGKNLLRNFANLPGCVLLLCCDENPKQIEKLRKLKAERNNVKVKQTLKELKRAAEDNENVVLACIKAVRAYSTVGEICDVLREIHGEYAASIYF